MSSCVEEPISLQVDGLFCLLPPELIRYIFTFTDLRSLGCLAQVTLTGWLSKAATDDTTWGEIVAHRFRVAVNKSQPKFYGGSCWRLAYRSMSYTHRIPKSRYTSGRKVVFAKGGSRRFRRSSDSVSLWVMIGHTDNCETRRDRIQPPTTASRTASREEQRFVELNVCVQNVKSSFGSVIVDILDSELELIGSDGRHRTETQSFRPILSAQMRPRIIFLSSITKTGCRKNADLGRGVLLHPFDFCVFSIHFPCFEVFETDFLARALSLSVPVRPEILPSVSATPSSASAFFLPEKDVWNHYSELPGGCLSLNDRYRLVAA